MSKYIIRRTAVAIPLILAIATIVFVMLRVALPGDPAKILAGDRASPELIEQIRENLGLDRPVPEQYAIFLLNAVQGDLGRSVKFREPVLGVIAKAFPFTVLLTLLSVSVGTVLGLIVGIVTAVKRGTWVDNISIVFVVFFYSIPTFWLGLMLILIFAVGLRWLPVQGTGTWQHFVMPVITLGIGQAALIARLTRSSMIEILGAHYVQTARAKGLRERWVILRHALRNTLIPIITVVGISIGSLLGGAVITENIFGLPGVGRLAIEAIHNRDYPMIQGTVLLVATAFIFVNLVVDVIYVYVDPRIRYE
ncbi:MAG: peptide ABC transporter permease [Anaerolineaceae bacterium]|nr:peptide ABC transporter permease [Anaerolineaceae bacterium]